MTRNAEPTPNGYEDAASVGVSPAPSPQSVVVPVEPTEAMLVAPDDAGVGLYSREVFAQIWSAMLAAAPAPSSLAGGEDMDALLIQRAHELAALDGNFGNMTTPYAKIALTAMANRLAALSPEAPAREGEPMLRVVPDTSVEGCYRLEDAPTPRHEAEGAGERLALAAESAVETMVWLWINHVSGPPAERLATAYSDLRDALRARSSAPEAREGEAVAWQMRVMKTDGTPHSGWKYHGANAPSGYDAKSVQFRPLFAAPSADKLRIAVEALEGSLPQLEVLHSIVSGKEARSSVWREITKGRQALAALQAEQKGGAA